MEARQLLLRVEFGSLYGLFSVSPELSSEIIGYCRYDHFTSRIKLRLFWLIIIFRIYLYDNVKSTSLRIYLKRNTFFYRGNTFTQINGSNWLTWLFTG